MDMSSPNMKDHHRISKSSARDHSSTMMMMIKNKSTTNNISPKTHSLLSNNSQTTSYEDQEDYMINAFSWPPRSYTCSFCKREFRSAQALGGHMNVHRKDRARLRQSPPSDIINGWYGSSTNTSTTSGSTTTFLNLNLNQSPNPNNASLNITTSNNNSLCSLTNSQPPLSSLLPSPYSARNNHDDIASKKWPTNMTRELDHVRYPFMKSKRSVCGVRSEEQVTNYKSLKNKITETTKTTTTTVRLDLEIGLLRGHDDSEIGRDLDLELRLGYSN